MRRRRFASTGAVTVRRSVVRARSCRRVGQFQRFDAVRDGRAHRLAAGNRIDEMRHFVGVRDAIAFEEKMLGLVVADIHGGVRGDFGGTVVARLQHALAAEDFEALVVTVGRAAAGVDLREPPRRVRMVTVVESMSPPRFDRRIGQAASGRIDGGGFVVENPAQNVEVVDQHVFEYAAGDLDVIDRGRARITAGDDQHFRFADLAGDDARLQRGERRIVAAL
jgi:hypothetical protein